jgi:hypothetical protein
LPACCRIAAKRSTTVAHCLPRAGEIFHRALSAPQHDPVTNKNRYGTAAHLCSRSLVLPQTSAVKIEL